MPQKDGIGKPSVSPNAGGIDAHQDNREVDVGGGQKAVHVCKCDYFGCCVRKCTESRSTDAVLQMRSCE